MSDKRRKALPEKNGGVRGPEVRPSQASQPNASGGGPNTSNGSVEAASFDRHR